MVSSTCPCLEGQRQMSREEERENDIPKFEVAEDDGLNVDFWASFRHVEGHEEQHTPVISSMRRPLDFAYSVGPYGIDIPGQGVKIVTYGMRPIAHVKSLRDHQLLPVTHTHQRTQTLAKWSS
jgi:hypothetical protein